MPLSISQWDLHSTGQEISSSRISAIVSFAKWTPQAISGLSPEMESPGVLLTAARRSRLN